MARSGPGWLTRGQPAAVAAIARMAIGPAAHAVLLVGPPNVGKTTLAEDLAAALLCSAADPAERPCRACRACRLVAHGDHPDVHRLFPEGPGGQIVIGESRQVGGARGVRDLVRDLALLPVEGGARVAIVEGAAQMNEDAQHALLKTLEEPPPAVTIILCADRDELLLPTVRSRCARIRLGPTGPREIEDLIVELGLADAPTAGRLARLAEGRPGVAIAYARAPEAVTIRDEIARTLLDLAAAPRSRRLAVGRELLARAAALAEALSGPAAPPAGRSGARPRRSAGPARQATRPADADGDADLVGTEGEDGSERTTEVDGAKASPAERRRAARQLLTIWRDVARDLAVAALGGTDGRRAIHDVTLLEELDRVVAQVSPGASGAFLSRLDRVAELVAGNVSPELAVDVLVLAWPSTRSVAA